MAPKKPVTKTDPHDDGRTVDELPAKKARRREDNPMTLEQRIRAAALKRAGMALTADDVRKLYSMPDIQAAASKADMDLFGQQ